MMVNLGAAVNVIHGIRTHHAQTTGCPTWDEDSAARGWVAIGAAFPELFAELSDNPSANPSANPSRKG